jgi:hypothetical protein
MKSSGMGARRLRNTAQAAHGSVVGMPFNSATRPRVEPGVRPSVTRFTRTERCGGERPADEQLYARLLNPLSGQRNSSGQSATVTAEAEFSASPAQSLGRRSVVVNREECR